ncbi:hypothetical protein [Paenibacillus alba]|uniref:Uncharacterized protein n=1 Tax=Paenibacillus alba TaxID=1197127 RepID=A0ABU6GHW0_9BACL|nr:hypothetical protein [Paenibacillus alba]MEC0232303.1 hypothetical protein [Paenibacillus alba]
MKRIRYKVLILWTLLISIIPSLTVSAHEHGGDSSAEGQMGPSELTINTSIISLIFVVLVAVVLMFHLRAKGAYLTKMTGMMAAMTIAMVSSLVVGTIAGILMTTLFVPTVIGVTFGMFVGYVSGKSLHMLASLDGMLAGLMGGMMGAMLGVMVISDYPTLTIVFMDIVMAISMLFLYKLLDHEEMVNAKNDISGESCC